MNALLAMVLSTAMALIPWGVKRIDKKLSEKDYPTAENRQDNEPRLAGLVAEAKGPEYLKMMRKVAENREIWWQVRQDAVLYLGSFLKEKNVARVLSAIVMNKDEEYQLRETAYRVVSPVVMSKKAKIAFLAKFAKGEDQVGQLHLRISKDLAELGARKTARKILISLLERSTLDPAIRTDAEEFLKFLN